MDITPRKRTRIVTLQKHASNSERKMAETVCISLGAVNEFLKQERKTGNVEIRKENCGKISPRTMMQNSCATVKTIHGRPARS